MGELRLLHPESAPRESVVAALREMLVMAERGDIVAVAAAYEQRDGSMAYRRSHGDGSEPMRLLGEVTVMQAPLSRALLDGEFGKERDA